MRILKIIIALPLVIVLSYLLYTWYFSLLTSFYYVPLYEFQAFLVNFLGKIYTQAFYVPFIIFFVPDDASRGEALFGWVIQIFPLFAAMFLAFIAVCIFSFINLSVKKICIALGLVTIMGSFTSITSINGMLGLGFYLAAEVALTILLIFAIHKSYSRFSGKEISHLLLVVFITIWVLPLLTLLGHYSEIAANQRKYSLIHSAKTLNKKATAPVLTYLPPGFQFRNNSGSQSTYRCESTPPRTSHVDFVVTTMSIANPELTPATYEEHIANKYGGSVERVTFTNSDGVQVKAVYDKLNNVLSFYDDYFKYTVRGNNWHDSFDPLDSCSLDSKKLIDIAKGWKTQQ